MHAIQLGQFPSSELRMESAKQARQMITGNHYYVAILSSLP
jgi:hypothetical protein